MPNIIRFLAVLIAFVALSPHGYSQTSGKDMEGIRSLDIIVPSLDDDAKFCGLSENSLRTAAAFPIATSRLTIDDSSRMHLQIDVSILRSNEDTRCIADYQLRLFTFQDVVLRETGLRKVVIIQLWEGGGVLLGPRNGFSNQMRETIEVLTKEFVVDWTLDQQ